MIALNDGFVALFLALPVAIVSLFMIVPMLLRLLPFKSLPIHKYVTSDIPGNPHVFDFSIISFLRTMPEPNNFNLVWTKVPLDEPIVVSGQLPPGRFSSYSVYPGLGAVPESTELEANLDQSEGLFELNIQRENAARKSTEQHTLVVENTEAPVGMLVMRNYLVPPGTMVRTPEIRRQSDNKIVRKSQQLIVGAASAHLHPPYWHTSFAQLALLHALVWMLTIVIKGLSAETLHQNVGFSVLALVFTSGLHRLLYVLGKKRMQQLGKEMAPTANQLMLCDLERSSKGSQPSKIHKYFFMCYDIPKGYELSVQGKIHEKNQKYWSLVAYDIYGVCLPQFVYDLNVNKINIQGDIYEYDIRMTNYPSKAMPFRKGLSDMDVSKSAKGYVLFRINHPANEDVVKFSQPVTRLVKIDLASEDGSSATNKQKSL